MHLSYNNLTGPIPSELGDLASLGSLYLHRNALTGPIPSELRQLEQLSRLIIEDNDGLCAPGTAVFVAWVEGIQYHRVPYCNESDRVLLASLYRATGGTSWSRTDGWLGSPVLATWYGVSADSLGRVEALELTGNGLSGQLPSDLGGLGRLTELRIGSNGLSGRLPVSLARLSLRTLHYSGTDLCAPPDPDFEDWLRSIPSHDGTGISCVPLSDRDILVAFYEATGGPGWADNNTNWLSDAPIGDWTGVDVDSAGRVTQLFFVRNNNLVGPITPVLGDLASLQRLVLSHNNLTGPIPPELGRLANLRDLSLDLDGPDRPDPLRTREPSQPENLAPPSQQPHRSDPAGAGRFSQLGPIVPPRQCPDRPDPVGIGRFSQLGFAVPPSQCPHRSDPSRSWVGSRT